MLEKLKALWLRLSQRVQSAVASLKGWRTVLFGFAVSAVGLWDSLSAMGVDVTPLVPEKYRPVLLPTVGIAVVGLRFVTTSGIGKPAAETN